MPLLDEPRARGAQPLRPARRGSTASSARSATPPARSRRSPSSRPSLFVNLDITFTALASVARPFLQETISESPPSEEVAIRDFPQQRPFLRNNTAFFRELRPAWPRCPARRRSSPTRSSPARDVCRRRSRQPGPGRRVRLARRLLRGPAGARGRRPADAARVLAAADARLPDAGPDHLQLRDAAGSATSPACSPRATPTAPGSASSSSRRRPSAAARHRAEQRGRALARARQRPAADNHLHSNPYPNTAAPGQTQECEAGNEDYLRGQTVIGNLPGNQGTRPSRPGASRRRDEARQGRRFTAFQAGLIALVVIVVATFLGVHEGHPVHDARSS